MIPYDVPGDVTLRDVSRSPRGETWPQAMHRLAAKALISGCQVLDANADGTRCRVTSARLRNVAYRVWLDPERHAARCECAAWHAVGICGHTALATAMLHGLPSLDTPPLVAAFAGRCSLTGQPIAPGDAITKSARGGWMLVDCEATPVAA